MSITFPKGEALCSDLQDRVGTQYQNVRYTFGQMGTIYLTSSTPTLKPSKTNSSLGKHPDNLMPYKIVLRHGIGAEKWSFLTLLALFQPILPTVVLTLAGEPTWASGWTFEAFYTDKAG